MTGKHGAGHDVDLAETRGKDTVQRFLSPPHPAAGAVHYYSVVTKTLWLL